MAEKILQSLHARPPRHASPRLPPAPGDRDPRARRARPGDRRGRARARSPAVLDMADPGRRRRSRCCSCLGILSGFGVRLGRVAPVLLVLGGFAVWNGYFILFEGLRRGQTPGKRIAGIRVVMDTGHAVTLGAAAARNLLRVADFLPPPYLIGLLLVAFHPRGKRLGDLVAGTIVSRDRPQEAPALERPRYAGEDGPPSIPELDDEDVPPAGAVRRAAGRAGPGRADPAGRGARGSAGRAPGVAGPERRGPPARAARRRAGPPAGRPVRAGRGRRRHPVRRAEAPPLGRVRAAGRACGRARASTASRPTSSPTSPPAIARSPPTWPGRAPTARIRPPCARLERLAAAGHNALYRDEREHLAPDLDRARARMPGGRGRGARGTCSSRSSPSSCRPRPASRCCASGRRSPPSCLPDVMLRRAEAGASRKAAGRGYVDVAPEDRALMASGIITNNVRVAIACFAGRHLPRRRLPGAAGLQRAGDRRLRGPLRQRRAARLPAHVHPGPRSARAVRHLGGGRGGLPAGALGRGAGTAEPVGRAGAERAAGGPDGRARRRCC